MFGITHNPWTLKTPHAFCEHLSLALRVFLERHLRPASTISSTSDVHIKSPRDRTISKLDPATADRLCGVAASVLSALRSFRERNREAIIAAGGDAILPEDFFELVCAVVRQHTPKARDVAFLAQAMFPPSGGATPVIEGGVVLPDGGNRTAVRSDSAAGRAARRELLSELRLAIARRGTCIPAKDMAIAAESLWASPSLDDRGGAGDHDHELLAASGSLRRRESLSAADGGGGERVSADGGGSAAADGGGGESLSLRDGTAVGDAVNQRGTVADDDDLAEQLLAASGSLRFDDFGVGVARGLDTASLLRLANGTELLQSFPPDAAAIAYERCLAAGG